MGNRLYRRWATCAASRRRATRPAAGVVAGTGGSLLSETELRSKPVLPAVRACRGADSAANLSLLQHMSTSIWSWRGAWVAVVASLTCGGLEPEREVRAAAVGEFEDHADIGSPRIRGSFSYDAATDEYRLSAAGTNMWFSRDEFHLAWKRLTGDFICQARVAFVGQGGDPHRKLGWMARQSLAPDAAYVDAVVHGDGLTSLQFRRVQGARTEEVRLPVVGADVIQLERRGETYVFSAARFGEPFTSRQVAEMALGESPYVGLFVCSHDGDVLEQAVFRDVRIIRPARAGFVPYRDYLGSHLEILDVQTGRRRILYSSAQPFEAPNWTPDGRALLFNTSGRDPNHRGRLYRFDLATRQATLLDTGFADRNNNDHVLSFDGTMLGISHHSAAHGGKSAVFTLPASGGTPRLLTPQTPSYLHGWSPDGNWVVYTGERDGEFDIYKRRTDGRGEEIRLTDFKGLDDGPEFTPDGKFIYFNSVRSGRMQLWRMQPDGSAPEPVTDDEFNNWFPHVSPDGQWIAFLSYLPEVPPTDHPYYRQVYLRLMPLAGGASKVIAYVYGGQGTINVPSWAPDSRRLAFVSNSQLP